jgi:acyl-CoA thioester hydrolase
MQPFITCYRGVAQPWLCDRLGHLNTRHYFAALDDAAQHFFSILGYEQDPGFGWADVSHTINYSHEVPLGALFQIDIALLRVGRRAISYRQQVILSDSKEVAATCDAVSVLFDLDKREAVEAPEAIRENGGPFTLQEADD